MLVHPSGDLEPAVCGLAARMIRVGHDDRRTPGVYSSRMSSARATASRSLLPAWASRWFSIAVLVLAGACDPASGATVDAGTDAPRLDTGPRIRDAGGPGDSGAHCDLDAGPSPVITACNGHAELCDRAYDDVAIVMTHNAMSSAEDGFSFPNQERRLWRQLEDGVRGFMLDVHVEDGAVLLCHGPCALGRRPFVEGLRDLRVFLECNPGEVVTIVLESYATEAQIETAFVESGLAGYLHAQPIGDPWPTLREMITAGRRVVVFTADSARTLPWHHFSYDYAWENPYAADTPAALSCAEDRGSRTRSLWIFNHFLTAPLASRPLAEMINHDPFFSDRVATCRTDAGSDLPNFVTVDFYDIGDVFSVVDALNGF